MQLQSYMDPGEHLLWQGAPQSGLRFRSSDAFLIPFSVLWCGFAIFWLTTAAAGGAPPYFLLIGAAFVTIGVYFVFGRFFVDARRRSQTEYGLTDKRALILSGMVARELSSFPLSKEAEIRVSGRESGRGSIKFGPGQSMILHQSGLGVWHGPEHPFMFEGIEKVSSVYEQVRSIQNSSRNRD